MRDLWRWVFEDGKAVGYDNLIEANYDWLRAAWRLFVSASAAETEELPSHHLLKT